MNAKISMFFICAEAITYLLLRIYMTGKYVTSQPYFSEDKTDIAVRCSEERLL